MDFDVDRCSRVPVRQQLKGMLEYAIACGELVPGELLPSVRELAARIGVAPMTVSQVYNELKKHHLVTTRPGSGTRVSEDPHGFFPVRSEVLSLHRQIDSLIDAAAALDVQASDLSAMIEARGAYRANLGRRASIVIVGLFAEATASYARFIAQRLGREISVAPMTIDAIERDPVARARATTADLVVTLVNQHHVVAALLGATKTVAVRFIPSEKTRRALASIDPMARVFLVSRFASFLPLMKTGVRRFAAHVSDVRGGSIGDEGLDKALQNATVVVFATGAQAVLDGLGPGTAAIEFRHIPDPADIEDVILPSIHSITSLPTQRKEAS